VSILPENIVPKISVFDNYRNPGYQRGKANSRKGIQEEWSMIDLIDCYHGFDWLIEMKPTLMETKRTPHDRRDVNNQRGITREEH